MEWLKEKISSKKESLGILGEFLGFLWKRRIWWMIPVFLALALIGAMLIFAQSSALSPFVYTLI